MTAESGQRILYLSPHLDDAVLSAGGFIAAQAGNGDAIFIASFCTADPTPQQPLSALATDVHGRWGNPSAPYANRRHEDTAACAMLGANAIHLGLLDAIYRHGAAANEVYRSFGELFGPVPTWDFSFTQLTTDTLANLINEIKPARIYAPLAVGDNVDHQHVLSALLKLQTKLHCPLGFYEDQPYSSGYLSTTHDAVTAAIARLPSKVIATNYPIDFKKKRSAILCYQSQLTELFGNDSHGLEQMERYAHSLSPDLTPTERIWTFATP